MNENRFVIAALIVTSIFLLSEPAFAGPGGKIASAAFETFWGRIALGSLTIIFLPLITYILLREKLSERRARKDLRFMAAHCSQFEWLKIQERVKDCFFRVHSGWEDEDLSGVKEWMTDWYWQNQQLAHLERWKKEGLKNICDVKKITNIKPLLFVHRNHGQEHEDSMVVISIEAKMKDYLEDLRSGKVVEGSKRYKEVGTIWSLTMSNGQWKVSDIEEGSMSLAYAKLVKDLPDIETTVVSDLRA
ncbi:hypothetical protein Maes01_02472 [Microbulbifer aestuariivivens]|uniref:Tim44-like domain-containing protein n=1 Tax=Microbulbifer aestuariivivens TaxID=1908308 RepID=A0ABP9WS09_9GAMM